MERGGPPDEAWGGGPLHKDPWAEPVQAHEPPLKLPWPAAALVAFLIGVYGLEALLGGPDQYAAAFGFIPAALHGPGAYGLVTALFIHGSWGHVLVNSAFAVAFCAPVARRLGSGAVGAGLFFLFFLVCGVAGNLGYALVHPNDGHPVVGASGAIAGFMAAASRLFWRGPGLAPLTSPTVVTMAVSIIALNLVVGLFHVDPGLGSDGASIAWETHVVGYVAGLFLIDLFDRAAPGPGFHRRKD